MELEEMFDATDNLAVFDSLIIANNKINVQNYKKITCFISGGSDSDISMHICSMLDNSKKVSYVFFDTGLEYQATKDHLKFLQDKYGVEIHVEKAVKPIPTCCKEYGQPFLSKQVSEWIERLQRNNFQWEDEPFEQLIKKYPNCKAALKWWCNKWQKNKNGSESRFNIAYNMYLKEFMVLYPPKYKISNKCCHYAKKLVAKRYKEQQGVELSITGIRKAEGGARASAYKNCFSSGVEKGVADEYRIIFFYKEDDKRAFEKQFNICHSACYSEYGLKRTGCAGCPYGQDFEQELEVIQQYEPKLYKAVNNIFGDSYEYTRKYKQFVKEQKEVI